MPDPERERLVRKVEEADARLNDALQRKQWLYLRGERNAYERARNALAAYDRDKGGKDD